ncbi:phosphoribosylformylglycinamidine synthase subunit PurL [Candidatus Sumerlaeota bacterium]|nr:phosphoribosylformylglycinamidine synthase subunit PurL [Candidatus Sumerlaeota bacterium]
MVEALKNDPAMTPELIAEHGITPAEYDKILQILGREPTFTELGIFSVMWSEHCSYKNSKKYLKKLPTRGPRVLQGPGENAGIVDIGEGLAVAFKIESHNHPSYVEPYQGAATGIGGILRDIFTMGARPIALVDPLRFGDPRSPKNRHIIGGVVKGIADYGNCVGVPTVGGETHFSRAYNGNPLINVMCIGLMKHSEITRACASRTGDLVFYFGNSTGRDGVHGATFASQEMSEQTQAKRSAVQVGDPFMGKKILEATLDLIQAGAVEGMQDMGAAGLTCCSCEMAGKGDAGVVIDLDKVPQRAADLHPYEMMLSESQERMLAVCRPEKLDEVKRLLAHWDLEAHVLGQVTDDGMMRVRFAGKEVAAIPAELISTESPEYDREYVRSSYLDSIEMFDEETHPAPKDLKKTLLDLLATPELGDKRWIYEQYDHMVQLNTVLIPGESSGVLRIKDTDLHIAIASDCNGLMCWLDPRMGARMAVAESARNLACSGARPLAITNCLNFGNPMKPEIFYQFKEAVEGMGEACAALDTPVTGGNVSFYNENQGEAVWPTPVIGMIGLVERPEHIATVGFKDEGDVVLLVGGPAQHLGGSQLYALLQDKWLGPCPTLDLEFEKRLIEFVLDAIRAGLVKSAQDISEGGLAVALAECCLKSPNGLGAEIDLAMEMKTDAAGTEGSRKRRESAARLDIELFSEAPSRVVLTLAPDRVSELEALAAKAGIPIRRIGRIRPVSKRALSIASVGEIEVSDLRRAFQSGRP